jgi:hypothetical protein
MRGAIRAVLIITSLIAGLLVSVRPAIACTGGDAPLSIGIRGASSIYYAKIADLQESVDGFYDLELDVGRVIKGTALRHVGRVVTPRACDGLQVGDAGVVVLGSVNPYGVGPNDIYNFFYVLGAGHTSPAEARRLLSLPATDTASIDAAAPSDGTRVVLLAGAALISLVIAAGCLFPRSRGGLERQAGRMR